jgi:hypothetical protein
MQVPTGRLVVLTVMSLAGLAFAVVSGRVPRLWLGVGLSGSCQMLATCTEATGRYFGRWTQAVTATIIRWVIDNAWRKADG